MRILKYFKLKINLIIPFIPFTTNYCATRQKSN
jgi:hypothetical protein